MFAEGWVVYPRPSGWPEPWDPLVLGYTTQPAANILIFIIAHALQLIYNI